VVEGGREVCLEDAHALLHHNDSGSMVLSFTTGYRFRNFRKESISVPKTASSTLFYSITLHVLYMWTRSNRMVRA
jgi:hypothetical protein